MKKKLIFIFTICLCILAFLGSSLTTRAYTEEQKQQAKAWLSAHGYPPTRAGAEQAYSDYLNGKFDEELGINRSEDEDEGEEQEIGVKEEKSEKTSDNTTEQPQSSAATADTAAEASTEDARQKAAEEMEARLKAMEDETEDETETSTAEDIENDTGNPDNSKSDRKMRQIVSFGVIGLVAVLVVLGGIFVLLKKNERE